MSSSQWRALSRSHIWQPFTQHSQAPDPLIITRAQGVILTDDQGREYLDLISSWWVTLHGHGHPLLVEAIATQAARLDHVLFARFTHEPALLLAGRLIQRLGSPFTRVFYSDNGSTAVEVALKMAIQYWHNRQQPKKRVIAFEKGYHGDTFGAMSLGQSSGFYRPFQEHLFSVAFLPYPATWTEDLETHIEEKEAHALQAFQDQIDAFPEEIAALIVEPLIQGAGGMRFCRPSFLERITQIAQSHGILVIYDEVMTGFGRTGHFFACHSMTARPDLICLSKGITGGTLPLAVTVTTEEIYEGFLGSGLDKSFLHGHSYTANPIGCAAALASLTLLEEETTWQAIRRIESIHRTRLEEWQQRSIKICQTRVQGSIAAFQVVVPRESHTYGSEVSENLKELFLKNGLNLRPLGATVYLMPPYTLTPEQLHDAYDRIERIVETEWSGGIA